jgi:acetolactate synthase-1/2/3 large subunit
VTAIASCFFDSTPVIFVTGQVHSSEIRTNPNQRQNGFQELDIVAMVKGITKVARRVVSSDEIAFLLEEMWNTAINGRKGPVLLDIPIDIQQHSVPKFIEKSPGLSEVLQSEIDLSHVYQILKSAKKPLILAGGGVRLDGSVEAFRSFVDEWELPVVTSLMGLDSIESNSRFNLGLIGSYGHDYSNNALYNCDVLIALGTRMDVRQIPWDPKTYSKDRVIIRVDCDKSELTGRIAANFNFEVTVRHFLENLRNYPPTTNSNTFLSQVLEDQSIEINSRSETGEKNGVSPAIAMNAISDLAIEGNGFVVDVGQHQMWAAQFLKIQAHQRFFTSGGLGSMGFSLPAAIGASLSTSGRWMVIVGDGGFQIISNELETIKLLNLDITIVVFNNHQHGMVAQFQRENLESRFVSTRLGYSSPDFLKLSEAYGIRATRIQTTEELSSLPSSYFTDSGPALIEVEIDQSEEALPKFKASRYPIKAY